jgi:DNA-binding NarL/FixJ family response regulator
VREGGSHIETCLTAAVRVLGPWARLELLAAVCDIDLDEVARTADRLAADGWLVRGESSAYELGDGREAPPIAAALLAVMHGRAARELSRRGAPDEDVCAHALAAPGLSDGRMVKVLRRHAGNRLEAGRPEEAVDLLQRAILEPPPPGLINELLLELAEALVGAQRSEEAIEVASRVRSRSRGADRRTRAAVVIARAHAAMAQGERAARTLLTDISAQGEPRGPTSAALRHELLRLAALGDEPMRVWITRYQHDGQADATHDLPSYGLLARTQRAMVGDMSASEAVAITREELGRHSKPEDDVIARFSAAWLLIRADERELAASLLEESRTVVAEAELSSLDALRGLWLLRFGSVPEAVQRLEEAQAHGSSHNDAVGESAARAFLAHALFETDEAGRLAALLADHPPEEMPNNPWAALLRIARARQLQAGGAHEPALRDLMIVEQQKAQLGLRNPACYHQAEYAVEALRGLGRTGDALDLARENLERARRWGAPITVALAEAALARCQAPKQAGTTLARSLRRLAPMAPNLFHAQLSLQLADVQLASGQRRQAEALLGHALEEADAIGAHRLERQARVDLRRLGRRPRRSARRGVEALTPAESRVAELAGAGHSNRTIASLLHLSERTVENHLRRVYQKLDTDRAGLNAQLVAGPGVPQSA